jgi:hypothetical protein
MKILNTNAVVTQNVYGAGRTRLQLDPAGGGMMVQNMRLMNNGVVIEEINEYNQLVALKHDYDRDQALLQIKAKTEGGTIYNPATQGTLGSSKSGWRIYILILGLRNRLLLRRTLIMMLMLMRTS